jgi:hypothetical protein
MNIVITQAPQLLDFQTWVERHNLTLCVHITPQPDESKLYYIWLKNNTNQDVIAQNNICKVAGEGKTSSKAVDALIANLNKCGYINIPTAWHKTPKFKFVFNQKLLEEAEQELYDTH